jgi:hypothetical protein
VSPVIRLGVSCSVEDCKRPVFEHGICARHFLLARAVGVAPQSLRLCERIWEASS